MLLRVNCTSFLAGVWGAGSFLTVKCTWKPHISLARSEIHIPADQINDMSLSACLRVLDVGFVPCSICQWSTLAKRSAQPMREGAGDWRHSLYCPSSCVSSLGDHLPPVVFHQGHHPWVLCCAYYCSCPTPAFTDSAFSASWLSLLLAECQRHTVFLI